MTTDAKENEMILKENVIWDTGATGLKAETKLMNELEEIFIEPGSKMNLIKWHKIMKQKIEKDRPFYKGSHNGPTARFATQIDLRRTTPI